LIMAAPIGLFGIVFNYACVGLSPCGLDLPAPANSRDETGEKSGLAGMRWSR